MAETLINKLSGIRQFIVQQISSVRKYNALDQNPIEAGQELGLITYWKEISRWTETKPARLFGCGAQRTAGRFGSLIG